MTTRQAINSTLAKKNDYLMEVEKYNQEGNSALMEAYQKQVDICDSELQALYQKVMLITVTDGIYKRVDIIPSKEYEPYGMKIGEYSYVNDSATSFNNFSPMEIYKMAYETDEEFEKRNERENTIRSMRIGQELVDQICREIRGFFNGDSSVILTCEDEEFNDFIDHLKVENLHLNFENEDFYVSLVDSMLSSRFTLESIRFDWFELLDSEGDVNSYRAYMKIEISPMYGANFTYDSYLCFDVDKDYNEDDFQDLYEVLDYDNLENLANSADNLGCDIEKCLEEVKNIYDEDDDNLKGIVEEVEIVIDELRNYYWNFRSLGSSCIEIRKKLCKLVGWEED